MAVPKRKTSKSRKRRRRAGRKVVPSTISVDKDGTYHLPHRVNPETGEYRGRQVIPVSSED